MIFENDVDEPEDALVLDSCRENIEEDVLVDSVEVVAHVCFKYVAWSRVVSRCFALKFVEAFEREQRAVAAPVCVAVVDECFVEERLNDLDERVMNDAVAEVGPTNPSCFRVTEDERCDGSWYVRLCLQFSLKCVELLV